MLIVVGISTPCSFSIGEIPHLVKHGFLFFVGYFMNNILKERVIALAKARKVSIRQLEKDIGIADKSITKWDVMRPSIDKVEAVANYFDVSVDYLLGNDEIINDEILEIREQIRRNPETKTLFDVTKNCTKEQIESVVSMLKTWKSQ